MASVKLTSLIIRTLSKPIAAAIKSRVKESGFVRERTIALAQRLHKGDMYLRGWLLGHQPKHVRALSDTKAIDMASNFLSEAFLFSVAASLVIGETWRSRSKAKDAREELAEKIEDLEQAVLTSQYAVRLENGTSHGRYRRQLLQYIEQTSEERRMFQDHQHRLTSTLNAFIDIAQRSGSLRRAIDVDPELGAARANKQLQLDPPPLQ
jgi:hypothetical protein